MINNTLVEIFKSREDLSDYVYHFTSGAKAYETFQKILFSDALIDVNKKGVICFTEAPLTSLCDMFKIFEKYPAPKYATYGIAVKKDYLFKLGGRPVIYGSSNEKLLLDDTIQWRFEEYNPSIKDFSWLREWRLIEEKLKIDSTNFFIITKYESELNEHMFDRDDIGEIEFDGCMADGRFSGYAYTQIPRKFKGISFESLNELDDMSKHQIDKILDAQSLNDKAEMGLGAF